MAGFTKWVDLRMTDEERLDLPSGCEAPDVPYCCCFAFDTAILDKLAKADPDLDGDPETGEIYDIRFLAKVRSVSRDEQAGGILNRRVEFCPVWVAVENESTEAPGDEDDE